MAKIIHPSKWQVGTIPSNLITSTGSTPTLGAASRNSLVWRRVGDSAEIVWNYANSAAGIIGSGNYLFNIPSYIGQIDTTKMPASQSGGDLTSACGEFTYVYNAGQAGGEGTMFVYSATQLWTKMVDRDVDGAVYHQFWSTSSRPHLGNAASFTLSIRIKVPIQGWA